jgi:hypothetical protein
VWLFPGGGAGCTPVYLPSENTYIWKIIPSWNISLRHMTGKILKKRKEKDKKCERKRKRGEDKNYGK